MKDKWNNANSYESYVGRWSRLVAPRFISWLKQSDDLTWLDVGCGTGALCETIFKLNRPKKIVGVEPSESHIKFAIENFRKNERASFLIGEATNIPLMDNSVDAVVSGLVLNFIRDIKTAMSEFKRVCRNEGLLAGYVWDYSDRMEMMRYFWNAAVSLFEDARSKDEGVRFPVCNEERLKQLFQTEGLSDIESVDIDVETVFQNFDDFWNPFLSGLGPAPGYCLSLSEEDRRKLKQRILESLPFESDGSIRLVARAIAIKAKIIK